MQAGVIHKGFAEKVRMSDKLSVHIRSDQIEEAVQSFLAGRSGLSVFPALGVLWRL